MRSYEIYMVGAPLLSLSLSIGGRWLVTEEGNFYLLGRVGNRFVAYVIIRSPEILGGDHPLRGLKTRERETITGKKKEELWGLVLARPLVKTDPFDLYFILERPYEGSFRPLCVPPLGGSRWWVYKVYVDLLRMPFYDKEHEIYVLDGGRVEVYRGVDGVVLPDEPMSFCKAALGVRFGLVRGDEVEKSPRVWLSPVGKPMSIPGSGSLLGVELPVVRRRFGYLRVGGWLAWHRVLGLLDDGRWVLVGDDGLYEAVFTPTVKNPLEDFGEVGYVKVLRPYDGDVDEVATPCGAPRLVACVDDTREALLSAGHKCEVENGIPHVLLGGAEVYGLGREVIDWPLADACSVEIPKFWHLCIRG